MVSAKAPTDKFIVALEDIGAIAASKNSELLGSHEGFRKLFRDAVVETQPGGLCGLGWT